MESDYNRLLRETEEVDGYNDAVYGAITQDLESMVDNLGDEYFFSEDVRSGDAVQDVYDYLYDDAHDIFQQFIEDPEMVVGHNEVWRALVDLKKVQPWHDVGEEDALGMEVQDYDRWKASRGDPTDESICEGIASVRKNYLETEKISQEVFDAIEDADPTKQKKYMDWMASQVVNLDDPKGEGAVQWIQNVLKLLVQKFNLALEKNQIPKDKRDIYLLLLHNHYTHLYPNIKLSQN